LKKPSVLKSEIQKAQAIIGRVGEEKQAVMKRYL
jgi:hypothetical protein